MKTLSTMVNPATRALKRFREAMRFQPYQQEVATLARDMADREYALVGRGDVVLVADGGTATAYYVEDGVEATDRPVTNGEEITRYSLTALRERGEDDA